MLLMKGRNGSNFDGAGESTWADGCLLHQAASIGSLVYHHVVLHAPCVWLIIGSLTATRGPAVRMTAS